MSWHQWLWIISKYESDILDDESDVLAQPQHRSIICGCGLVRIRGGRFRRCGRVGAHVRRTDAVPRVANQPFMEWYYWDFESPNIDKLFHENEGPDI